MGYRYWVRLVACALACAILCGPAAAQPLRVGSEIGFPPYVDVDAAGQATGFAVELFAAVAQAENLTASFEPDHWDVVWRRLQAGEIDALPLVARMPEREGLVVFSRPHTIGYDNFFVRRGAPAVASIEQARSLKIIVLRSDAAHHALASRGFDRQLVFVDRLADGFRLLASGHYDAVLAPRLQGNMLIKQTGLTSAVAPGPLLSEYRREFCFAVRPGDSALRDRLNQGLARVEASGEYDRLYRKWLEIYDPPPFPVRHVAAGAGALALLLALWTWTLGRQVTARTAALSAEIGARKAAERELLLREQGLEQQVAQRTAELAQAAENTRLFVKHAPIGIAMLDRDMNYLAVSDRWLAEYGRGHADLSGRNHYEVHPDVPPEWQSAHRQGLAGATVKKDEDLWTQADGSRRWLRWAVLPWTDAGGKIGGIIISAEDITARKQTEEALRESEARFGAMADSAPVLIWVSGPDKLCNWFNRRWLDFTGRSMEQELGNGWLAGVHGDDLQHCLTVYNENFDRHQAFEIEYRLRNAAGEYRWLLDRGVPHYGPGGAFVGYIGSCIDITERKAAEQQLAEARDAALQASRAKSVFLANMSHEIRTPLHVITGLGHLLRRDLTDSVQRDRLDQLCATSDHLLGIISDILDLAKIEAQRLVLDRVDFRLDTVVDKVVRMIEGRAQEKGLTLATDFAPRLRGMALNGDALRLAQVLINLGDNAVKFTDQGSVRLGITCLAEHADGVALRFSVEDTGIGMAPPDQARLFQAFQQADSSTTRERGGTGLGLVISQRLVALMGGTIRVASQPGTGSSFSFELRLPRAAAEPQEAAAGAPATTDFSGRNVLFAEDHPLSREILFEMLEDLGCVVDVAADGVEAVECARARGYDLILMDMQMPKMDGLAATRAIRALPGHAATPIIALTANAFAEDRQRCFDAGMNGHVGKPVTPATLAAALGLWLPDLGAPPAAPPPCENELARALAQVPGLTVPQAWRHSPQRLADYCAQLQRFVAEHGQDMARLAEHLAGGDHDAAHVLAHNLKGIAGLIGARRIATLADDIVQALRAGADDGHIAHLASACAAEFAGLTQALRGLPAPSSSAG